MKTMVHQLAHALCFGHEHQRGDRDQYLNYSNCTSTRKRKIESLLPSVGIYDYASQMHSKCGTCDNGGFSNREKVEFCGPDASPGLSVLDVDKINQLYSCKDCHRHRWIAAEYLSHADFTKMTTFGYETNDTKPLYACRTFHQGEVTSGTYDYSRKTCKISWDYKPHEIHQHVEVLTIPGGERGKDCTVYKLEDWRNALEQGNNLVYVGNILHHSFYWNWTSHIAYSDFHGNKAVGKTWLRNGKEFNPVAEMSLGTSIFRPEGYQVLTCRLDTTCMLKQLFESRNVYQQECIK